MEVALKIKRGSVEKIGHLMTLTFPHIPPVLPTKRTTEGLTVAGKIFDTREMVLVQV